MKKWVATALSFVIVLSFVPMPLHAATVDLAPHAKSAVLMDMDTGTVLYEKDSHQPLPPASITKIMTMLLLMEAVAQGKTSLDERVRVSDYAASMGGSQIYLEVGEEMSISDLLKGIAIASGNDASVAIAEHLAGTEEQFVQLMNERAEELGMKDTRFVNSNGLPADEQRTSAHDIAIMSRELLKHEGITKFTKLYQDYLRQETDRPFWLVNTNKLVKFYDGVDGLKTGYTSEAKFCLSATAKRGDFRVIAVVMGEPNTKTRNAEVSRMLDYAFNQFTNHVLVRSGERLGHVRVDKGEPAQLTVKAPHQFSILAKKGSKREDFQTNVRWKKALKAPLKAGDAIGEFEVTRGDETVNKIVLTANKDVPRATWWTMTKRTLKKMLFIDSDARDPEQEKD
ncbi:D-alanyl-D-alanine carboxypeptidase family protein [Numidum massiliense]|uniref:D-alanyl-D-alanine carboxypeptidase family protein n=1 Tax=Numidum massiliense TaxID=1522315 RepID=UPI0006D56998|nr:D-alanyl-D-alanine carboxypeptidase family protein [Numidum massiliense]